MKKEIMLKLAVLGLIIVGGLVVSGLVLRPAGADTTRRPYLSPGVDLVVDSITVEPLTLDVGQRYTVTMVIRNQGDTNSGGFRTHLYIDPPDRPPTPTTPDTYWTYRFGLNPGESFTWRYSDDEGFTTVGCDHVVYTWVDRDDDVSEDDETNNLSSVQVCVGTTPTPTPTSTPTPTPPPTPCVPDEYEPDDTCPTAQEISTDGTHQLHNLCPVGDEDWVQFTARAGITYTIETTAVGEDGDTVLALHSACEEPPITSDDPISGTVARIVWHCTASGVYSVEVSHYSTDYGPAANYDLSITASTSCPEDIYENDDGCDGARDISADGASQTHIFCAAEDQDWVKFHATSGSTVLIRTDNLGPAAEPMLSIFDACDVPLSIGHSQQLEWIASTDEIYYVKLENHDPQVYGPGTNYDLSVATLGCEGDEHEFNGGDDDASKARLIQANDPKETHNFCPAEDEDWVKFDAVGGLEYVIETFNLSLDSDTHICLYEADGATEITCDDDSTGTKAARIIWTCPSDGTYYVQVRHYDPGSSGPNTEYDLSVTIGLRVDGYEPDDRYTRASPISDGVTQTHNFTPADDEDWVKFNAVPGDYAIQTFNLANGCDTILQVYDTDGVTLLEESDDFTYGLGSRVTYTIPSAGTYYARVRNYPPSRFGSNMQYDLLLVEGTPPPVPTPTPVPTPAVPQAPPPSSVRTLILVNRERIRALYGPDQATQLMNQLFALASHPSVLGNIVQVETDAAVAAAYDEWIADLLNTAKANDVASAVRNLVLSYLDKNPNVEYIVIVGNDEVIPFRRTLDRTSHPEGRYQVYVSSNTTVWAACGDDMTLTDSYYADREPTEWAGHELYIPDYAIGRLIETPEEIMNLIDLFLAGHTMQPNRALVSGYDFIQDVAGEMCNTLGTDLGSGNVDCELIGETWDGNQLRDRQLDTVPRFDIQSINGHASYSAEGAPQRPNVRASTIADWGSSDLSRALIYTLGCHSGLNDVGSLPRGLDLAQAFSQRGANYVANTGYGWGLGNAIGLSERLMYNYAEELMRGGTATIGGALMVAKQRYYAETASFGDYDEKILIESTLYGLPMYEIYTGAALEEDPFPSMVMTSVLPLPLNGLGRGHLELGLSQSFASLDETETTDGTFFDLDGYVHLGAGEPIQPKFFADVTMPDAGRAHGVVFTGGTYTDTEAFDPVVVRGINEYFSPTVEPEFAATGWYPPVPFVLHNSATVSGTETLVAAMGQYDSAEGVERIYDDMSFDVYYSDSYDWWEPIILSVNGGLSRGTARIKVEATDSSGIHQVIVIYTAGTGTQVSEELTYDPATLKWMGEIPAAAATTFYVQVVDEAGNVATDDNKGAWYALEEIEAGPSVVYLPLVFRDF